ncbi:hypothetical protein Taro_008831 [Colocasia esculenta]|uniref:Uncharacterized protein n=1 Tax=Colocasia esculenta TaxID=4460 RepID=A0A843U326_COLES|nr:hypothetical protein [Colocasia esculenta]
MKATIWHKTYHVIKQSCFLVPIFTHLSLTWILDIFAHNNTMFHIFFTQVSSFTWFTLHIRIHIVTYTFTHGHIHITHFPLHILGAVTHSPNHQRRTYTHHITHRCHLGIPMATLGLRRPGEQVSTLTSGTCPPPGFPPNALRVTYTLNFLRGTFP